MRSNLLPLVLFSFAVLNCGKIYAQKVHAILVGDTSPSTNFGDYISAIKNDLTGIAIVLGENLPQAQLETEHLEFMEDEWSSPKTIIDALDQLKVAPNDTIFFYYTGHGSVDDQGHFFALAHGKLYRREVLNKLAQKRCRLVVLLSDCCNTRSDGFLYMAPYFEIPDRRRPTPLFQKLFFDTKGVVDINSSSPGESAFFAPLVKDEFGPQGSPGSIFTLAWIDWVNKEKQNPRTWDDMVRAVSLKVHKSFRDYYPKGASIAKGAPLQTDQNVYPLVYPNMPSHEGPRTGLIVRDFPGKGSVITEVAPGSPGAQVFALKSEKMVSLQPQQAIIAINGKNTPNTAAVVEEVNKSPQIMRLTIRDAKQGSFDVLLRMKY